MIKIPHCESNVTSVCQNRCISCNHLVAVDHAWFSDPEVIRRDLKNFGRVCHADKYGMLGGEPTLHPKLPEIIRIVRDSGVADEVEVWSNGQRVRNLGLAFWEAPFDALVVSAYPGKITDEELGDIDRLCARHAKRFELKDERKFPNFTQLFKTKPTTGAESDATYKACWFKTFSRVLDNGFFYRCCTSPYIPRLLLNRPEGTDGLKVDENLTEDMLHAFLNQTKAMESCNVCAGRNTPDAVPVVWREIRDPAEWLAASSGR